MKKEFKSTLTKLFPAVICILVFIVSGCNQDDWEIKSDRCVFLEHHISTNGEIIEGNYHINKNELEILNQIYSEFD